jgi:RNA polymerase primary sigma factor
LRESLPVSPSHATRTRGSSASRCRVVRGTRRATTKSLGDAAKNLGALADQARTIRIPVHIVEKLNRIGRAERSLVTELGREPTPEEIAEVIGIEPDEVDSIKRSARAPVSLDEPVGDEEGSEFGQFIADEKAESPHERVADILAKEALREALEKLSYRERRVLELRYGLGGEHARTLDEVGRTFNVTRERIRQIENQSLKKLQSLAEAQKLREVA